MFLEFRSVVGQNIGHRVREDLAATVKELLCRFGSVRTCCPCESEAAVDILEGDDVPANTVHKAFDGIQGYKMTDILCLEIFRFSNDFLAINLPNSAKVGELLRIQPESSQVFDETSDGFIFGTAEVKV